MFKDYEIKNINSEEVLYLYLDLNTDLAKFSKQKKTSVNNEINKYINENKIKFSGKKIILIASGIIVGTMLFNAPLINDKMPNTNYNYTTNVLTLDENVTIKTSTKEETTITENHSSLKENNTEINKNTSNSTIKDVSNTSAKNTSKTSISTNKITSTNAIIKENKSNISSKKEVTQKNETINTKEKTETKTEISENKQMISLKRSNGTILYMELEEYLIGVVGAEMPASFHIEALKAQAVAARTYAIKAIKDNVILTDTVSTQAYKDNTELKNLWGNSFNTYYKKIKNAVDSTESEVMYYNNSLINAFYHSTSNGYTEDSTAVFGTYPYLKSVESAVDLNVSSFSRTVIFTYEELSNKLNIPITQFSNITYERNNSNRVSKIIIDNNSYDGVKFRTILGLRSTDFDIVLNNDNVSITTHGYGHGVGMSQYGANEYAKKGMTYKNILKHYYTNITIKNY